MDYRVFEHPVAIGEAISQSPIMRGLSQELSLHSDENGS
jgi:hypothetical protein